MLKRLTERAWYLPWEEETDRPNLCYLLGGAPQPGGGRRELPGPRGEAVPGPGGAGPSPAGLHRVDPLALGTTPLAWGPSTGWASPRPRPTKSCARWRPGSGRPRPWKSGSAGGEDIPFCNEHIRREYPRLGEIAVCPAAVELEGSLTLDLGGVRCQLLCQENPHAPDGLLVYVPQEGLVVLGDADCGDFYRLGGGYAPGPTRALARRLSAWDFQWALPGHSGPESKEGGAGVPGGPGGFWAACTKGGRCGGNSRGCLLNFLQERKRRGRARGDVLY